MSLAIIWAPYSSSHLPMGHRHQELSAGAHAGCSGRLPDDLFRKQPRSRQRLRSRYCYIQRFGRRHLEYRAGSGPHSANRHLSGLLRSGKSPPLIVSACTFAHNQVLPDLYESNSVGQQDLYPSRNRTGHGRCKLRTFSGTPESSSARFRRAGNGTNSDWKHRRSDGTGPFHLLRHYNRHVPNHTQRVRTLGQ